MRSTSHECSTNSTRQTRNTCAIRMVLMRISAVHTIKVKKKEIDICTVVTPLDTKTSTSSLRSTLGRRSFELLVDFHLQFRTFISKNLSGIFHMTARRKGNTKQQYVRLNTRMSSTEEQYLKQHERTWTLVKWRLT